MCPLHSLLGEGFCSHPFFDTATPRQTLYGKVGGVLGSRLKTNFIIQQQQVRLRGCIVISWENSRDILKELDKESCVKFALKAAKLVQHFNPDPRVSKAIEATEKWLANPCEENATTVADAAHAAWAAAWEADNTDTADARDAANAANAANDAANTAYAASDAYYATDAAYYAADTDPNVKPVLIDYLRELYLDSLPQDERDNWLVQTMIGAGSDS